MRQDNNKIMVSEGDDKAKNAHTVITLFSDVIFTGNFTIWKRSDLFYVDIIKYTVPDLPMRFCF